MWTLEWPTVGKAVGCLELLAGWLLHSLVCVPLPMLKGTQYFQAVHAAQCAAMLSSPASALTLLPAPVPRAETVPLNDENYLLPFWMVWAVGVAGLTEQCSRVEWKAAICSGRRMRGSSRPSPACLLSPRGVPPPLQSLLPCSTCWCAQHMSVSRPLSLWCCPSSAPLVRRAGG